MHPPTVAALTPTELDPYLEALERIDAERRKQDREMKKAKRGR